MAIKRKSSETQEKASMDVKVTRVKVWENGNISFDMIANGINIYGLSYITIKKDGEESSFISFPSRKGADGKYYNYCYFKIDDEMQAVIEKQIEELL